MTLSLAPFKHILFDLDGTLIDSSLLHAKAFRTVIDLHIPKLGEGFQYDLVRGKATYEVFEQLGVQDSESIERLTRQKQQLYRKSIEDGELMPMDGAISLLEFLKERGLGVHLVTGSSRLSVENALASTGLGSFLDKVITADDIGAGKPAPDGYALCVRSIKAELSECLAIEDAISGIDSAHAAGIQVVGVFDPTVQDLADYWVPNLSILHGQFSKSLETIK